MRVIPSTQAKYSLQQIRLFSSSASSEGMRQIIIHRSLHMIFMYGKSAVTSDSISSFCDKANPSLFHLSLELSASLSTFIAIPWPEPHSSVARTCAQLRRISQRRVSCAVANAVLD